MAHTQYYTFFINISFQRSNERANFRKGKIYLKSNLPQEWNNQFKFCWSTSRTICDRVQQVSVSMDLAWRQYLNPSSQALNEIINPFWEFR